MTLRQFGCSCKTPLEERKLHTEEPFSAAPAISPGVPQSEIFFVKAYGGSHGLALTPSMEAKQVQLKMAHMQEEVPDQASEQEKARPGHLLLIKGRVSQRGVSLSL